MGPFDVHPVLGQQLAARHITGGVAEDMDDEGFDFADFEDLRVSRAVAGFVAGAVVTLILLRVAGFRFSFGANIGGGS